MVLILGAFWFQSRVKEQTVARAAAAEQQEGLGEKEERIRARLRRPAVATEEHGGMPRALFDVLSGNVAANDAQIAALYESWARRNGPAAVSDALTPRPRVTSSEALVAAFGGWLLEDREGAFDWVENAPMGMWRRAECSLAVLRALPEADIATRGEWVSRFPDNATLISEFALGWSAWEPGLATDWLTQLPDGKGKFTGLKHVVRGWAEDDTDAVSRYIVGMQSGVSRDHAVAAFVSAIAELDPESAGVWVRTIEDTAIRDRASELVGVDELAGDLISAPKAPYVSRRPRR